jgi:hypothetical protein
MQHTNFSLASFRARKTTELPGYRRTPAVRLNATDLPEGELIVLRHNLRRVFLLGRFAQKGHLGSILAMATINR